MAKAVVMQVTDIKNRQQDMNTRQFFLTATHDIRPTPWTIRILPKSWLAAITICCLVALPQPSLAVPEQQEPPALDAVQPSHAPDPLAAPQEHIAPPGDAVSGKSGVDDQGRAAWRELEQGLFFGEFQLDESDARLTVLRIDPTFFSFTLCARSKDGGPSRPLNQWGEQYDLVAAINASMYLPDGSTSTGYMRQGEHVNNGRIVQRFGAFFVADPDEPSLPQAAILDRDGPLWRQQMDHYSLVIQNYRMINADRRILWSPGGPHYSISAVAQDGDGQILFMHCRQPVEAYSFAQQVLHLPLNVRTVMYVEGGGQAGLLVRSTALTRELVGLSPSGLLVTGDLRAVLPNVLGARRKNPADEHHEIPAQPATQSPTVPPATTQPAPALIPAQVADPLTTQAPALSPGSSPTANAKQPQPVTPEGELTSQPEGTEPAPPALPAEGATPPASQAAPNTAPNTAPESALGPAPDPATTDTSAQSADIAPNTPKIPNDTPAAGTRPLTPITPLTEPGTSLIHSQNTLSVPAANN